MEIDHEPAATQNKAELLLARGWGWLTGLLGKCMNKAVKVAKSTKKLGQDDPRRVIHSLKVGLALTLVSLIYYWRPLYDGFGVSGMWAVLTVVVVFEFTVGKLSFFILFLYFNRDIRGFAPIKPPRQTLNTMFRNIIYNLVTYYWSQLIWFYCQHQISC